MASTTTKKKKVKIQATEVTPLDMLTACLYQWKWFLLSFIITFSIALYFLLNTAPVYTRTATILIKTDAKSISVEALALGDIGGLTQSYNSMEDEIVTMRSPMTVQEVVQRLRLNVVYSDRQYLRKHSLYANEVPVQISFLGIDDQRTCQFNFSLHDDEYEITEFSALGSSELKSYNGRLKDTLDIGICKLVVTPSLYYNLHEGDFKCMVEHLSLDDVTRSYSSRLTINNEVGTAIVNISMTDERVPRADDFLNTIIAVYGENWIKDHNKTIKSTSAFIERRLEVISKDLTDVEQDISSFMSTNLVPTMEAAAGTYFQEANEANQKVDQLTNQMNTMLNIKTVISTSDAYQLLPVSLELPAEVSTLIGTYNETILQRNNYIASSSASNPLVKDLDVELSTLREFILNSIDNAVITLNNLQQTARAYQHSTTKKMADAPSKQMYLQGVERQQKVKEAVYTFLLKKREENELSQAFTAYNTRLVNIPNGSRQPTYPVKMKVFLIAFILGLLIPGVYFVMKTFLNNKVRGRKDIEQLSATFLGEIPELSQKKDLKKKYTIEAKKDHNNVINEAFRIVRTSMEFLGDEENKPKVFTVNSLNIGAGKTFITINLGATLSLNGNKVCLLDCDIRKASMSKYINRPKTGLTDYLRGRITNLSEIIFPIENYENLSMIPVGHIAPNPTELLHSKRFAMLIAELRQQFDIILIDCPPTEIVADTLIINPHCDASIFVIRAGVMNRNNLSIVEQYYQDNILRNMSIILNGTDVISNKFGYGRYGYGYSYGYGYGYGYTYTTTE